MKTPRFRISPAAVALCFTLLASSARLAAESKAPDRTPDGLVRVAKTEADLVYVRPGVNFAGYDQVVLVEPTIAFRPNWKSDTNFNRSSHKITDEHVARMIATGKQLLLEELAAALQKAGYTLASAPGPKVLAVKPAIWELDIYAPDPDGMANAAGQTFSEGSGEATFQIQLFDSVSGQKLADAYDQRTSADNSYSWRTSRSQASNKADARAAFAGWAGMLVKGLERTKAAGTTQTGK